MTRTVRSPFVSLALMAAVFALGIAGVADAYGPDRTWATTADPAMTPRSLAAGPTNVFALGVTVQGSMRIDRLSANGVRLASWDGTGTPSGPLDAPVAVATGTDGSVLVAEGARVRRFNPDGVELGAWAVTRPSALAVDPKGVVYVETGDGSLERRSQDGTLLTRRALPGVGPFNGALAVATNGTAYLVTTQGIVGIDTAGKPVGTFVGRPGGSGLAITSDQVLWATDPSDRRVRGYTLDGSVLSDCVGPGAVGAATASGRNLFVSDAATITRYGDSGKPACSVVPLRLSNFETVPAEFRAAKKRSSTATSFTYSSSGDAAVSVSISSLTAGVMFKGKCRAMTSKRTGGKRCTRVVRVGSVKTQATTGDNSFGFSGWVGTRKLATGRYEARAVARDAHGRESRVVKATFRIL
jgi:hypothetical protein